MITSERIEEIFEQMDTYTLELANEPSALGPQYFQDMTAQCRKYLNTVSLVISELNREKLALSGEIRKLEAVYELEYDDRIATDEHVKKLASIEDRKSTVKHMLKTQRQEIDALKDSLHAVESVSKVVSHRSRELHHTMTEIRDQRKLMQTELQTGAFYGDERPHNPKLTHSSPSGGFDVDDINAEELDALLEDNEFESPPEEPELVDPGTWCSVCHEPQFVTPSGVTCKNGHGGDDGLDEKPDAIEPEPEDTSDEAVIHRFLGEPSGAANKQITSLADEDELVSLLDGI